MNTEKSLLHKRFFSLGLVLSALPLLLTLGLSFINTGESHFQVTRDGYQELFTRLRMGELATIAYRSLLISLVVTVFSFVIAYLLFSVHSRIFQFVMLTVFTLPFLVNEVVRVFAWQHVLAANGVFNLLLSLISGSQVTFFNATNAWNIYAVMTLNCIPFGIFIFFGNLQTLPMIYWKATGDLKLGRWVRFSRIVLPLSKVAAASSMVVTFFVAFSLSSEVNFLGGDTKISIRNLILSLLSASKFQAVFALGTFIILFVIILYGLIIPDYRKNTSA